LAAAQVESVVDATVLSHELAFAKEQLQLVETKVNKLTLRSNHSGVVKFLHPADMIGRFIARGDVVGYVYEPVKTMQVPLRQEDVDLVRFSLSSIDVRFQHDAGAVTIPASLSRIVPAATHQLISASLGAPAGGEVAVSPSDPHGQTSLVPFFRVEIKLREPRPDIMIGERGVVRLNYGYQPLAWHLWRELRLLFLRELKF
jgi:putative peptide zinc metalloprotease protein